METDEGEKEVPAKKPKTEPTLVRHLLIKLMLHLHILLLCDVLFYFFYVMFFLHDVQYPN